MADPTSPEITSVLTEGRVFPPAPEFSRQAHIKSMEQYRELAAQAERDPEGYWGARGKEEIYWKTPFQKVLDWKAPFAKWYLGGTTNLSYNCLDRHLATHGDKTALLFEGEPGDQRRLSYRDLHAEVCKLANGLKSLGIKKGDRVGISSRA